VYQIGDVHARSRIVFGTASSQHDASVGGTLAVAAQSTCAALQTYAFQRQLGFSSTRT
jgi:hypothetical protein